MLIREQDLELYSTVDDSNELMHFGKKGMKWGHRKAPQHLKVDPRNTKITKDVKKDYNSMSNKDFKHKHYVSKKTYAKRVNKYNDPYLHRTNKKEWANKYKSSGKEHVSKAMDKAKKQKINQYTAAFGLVGRAYAKRKFK